MIYALAILLLGPAAGPPPAETPSAIVVRPEATDWSGLKRALELRIPHIPILRFGEPGEGPRPIDRRTIQVDLRVVQQGERLQIIVAMPDGRSYSRPLPLPDDDVERTVAATLASLLLAIEEGTVEPDEGVAPVEPVSRAVELGPNESLQPVVDMPSEASEAPPAQRPERAEFGLDASPGLLLALGAPRHGPRLVAASAQLGLGVRFRSGAYLGAGTRFAARDHALDHRVLRLRTAFELGYVFRRTHVELDIRAFASIEPWWVQQAGANAELQVGTRARRPVPAIGGGVRVSPGYFFAPRRGGLRGLRLAPTVEMNGSFIAIKGARAANLSAATGGGRTVELGRVGGAELGVGATVMGWF